MNALIRYLAFIVYFLTVVLGLSACGGGGSVTIISGVASKGPLNGSTVCAYAIPLIAQNYEMETVRGFATYHPTITSHPIADNL